MSTRAVRSYTSKTFPIDDTQFWPIKTPNACATWSIRAPSDCVIRTDPDDATTEDTLPAGTQEAAVTTTHYTHQRYQASEAVIWIKKSTVGAVVVIGKFFD